MQDYIRAGKVEINDVFPYVTFRKKPREGKEYFGKPVWLDSYRLQTFAEKGCDCVKCGIKGKFLAVEQHIRLGKNNPERFHLNLYAIREGEEILMTVDHILPASKGGKRLVNNLQPMCSPCNLEKGNKVGTY